MSVALVSKSDCQRRYRRSRQNLLKEIQLLKDLTNLKTLSKLSPVQQQTVDEALLRATEVVVSSAGQYSRSAIEMMAASGVGTSK